MTNARFFSAPSVYRISQETGGGRTLPLAAVLRSGSWFGSLTLALQQVDATGPRPSPPVIIDATGRVAPQDVVIGPEGQSHGNAFAFVSLGRVVSGAGLSLGGSVLWAGLHAQDGVTLLFPGSESVRQRGHALDVRFGLVKEWTGDRALEALVLHHRFGMTDDVSYLDGFWDPVAQQFVQQLRVERDRDRANTWGLHVVYRRPLTTSGWRLGWLGTANRISRPAVSGDELMGVPQDLGHSSAFDLGIGLSKVNGPSTFGIDAVFEPIWSTTWVVAPAPIPTSSGDIIPAGGRTLVNRYRFSNALLRMGVTQETGLYGEGNRAGFQLGLALRDVHYRLDQEDLVGSSARRLKESWLEWTPTWGLSLRFPQLELRYRGRVTNGTGRPGQPIDVVAFDRGFAPPNPLAQEGTLFFSGVKTVTHQISLSLPLR